MKPLSGKEVAKLLEKHGWQLLRVQGKANTIVRLSVPIHSNKPLKRGLLHHLLKMAEINIETSSND